MSSMVAPRERRPLPAGMRLAVMGLCFLHVTCVSAGFFGPTDLQPALNASAIRAPASHRLQAPSTGSSNPGRQRPLFARRGQYERQKIYAKKPKVVPHSGPPKVTSKPVKLKCSQLKQSCLPKSGCCDPNTTCHCRFFNAICFCRRTSS